MKYNIVLELENKLNNKIKILFGYERKALERILDGVEFVPGLDELKEETIKSKFYYSGFQTKIRNDGYPIYIVFCETTNDENKIVDRKLSVFINKPKGLYAADIEKDYDKIRCYYFDDETVRTVYRLFKKEDGIDFEGPIYKFEDTAFRFGITPDVDNDYCLHEIFNNIFDVIDEELKKQEELETNKQKVR